MYWQFCRNEFLTMAFSFLFYSKNMFDVWYLRVQLKSLYSRFDIKILYKISFYHNLKINSLLIIHFTGVTGEHGLEAWIKFNRTHYLGWGTFCNLVVPSASRAYCIMTLLSNSSTLNILCSIARVNDQVELFLFVIWAKRQ